MLKTLDELDIEVDQTEGPVSFLYNKRKMQNFRTFFIHYDSFYKAI